MTIVKTQPYLQVHDTMLLDSLNFVKNVHLHLHFDLFFSPYCRQYHHFLFANDDESYARQHQRIFLITESEKAAVYS